MKLYTVEVYYHGMCMKQDNPCRKYVLKKIKGDIYLCRTGGLSFVVWLAVSWLV